MSAESLNFQQVRLIIKFMPKPKKYNFIPEHQLNEDNLAGGVASQ